MAPIDARENMVSETMEGGCGCGAARYRVDRGPIFVNNCHCRQCQQQTGSTSVVNMFVESEAVTLLSGTVSESRFVAGSGGAHRVVRCADCGTALWSMYPRLGELGLGIRVGTLDDPGAVTPDAAIFLDDKMPWVTPPVDIPGFGRTSVAAELLPPERMERLTDLIRRRKAEIA